MIKTLKKKLLRSGIPKPFRTSKFLFPPNSQHLNFCFQNRSDKNSIHISFWIVRTKRIFYFVFFPEKKMYATIFSLMTCNKIKCNKISFWISYYWLHIFVAQSKNNLSTLFVICGVAAISELDDPFSCMSLALCQVLRISEKLLGSFLMSVFWIYSITYEYFHWIYMFCVLKFFFFSSP